MRQFQQNANMIHSSKKLFSRTVSLLFDKQDSSEHLKVEVRMRSAGIFFGKRGDPKEQKWIQTPFQLYTSQLRVWLWINSMALVCVSICSHSSFWLRKRSIWRFSEFWQMLSFPLPLPHPSSFCTLTDCSDSPLRIHTLWKRCLCDCYQVLVLGRTPSYTEVSSVGLV